MNILEVIGAWTCVLIAFAILALLTYFIAYANWRAIKALITKVSDWKTFREFVKWKSNQRV